MRYMDNCSLTKILHSNQARSQDFSLGGVRGLKNCRCPPPSGGGIWGGGYARSPEFYNCTDYILEHFNALLN